MYTINKNELTIRKQGCPVHVYGNEHAFNTALVLLLALKYDRSNVPQELVPVLEARLTS